jgi:hypothetical protein
MRRAHACHTTAYHVSSESRRALQKVNEKQYEPVPPSISEGCVYPACCHDTEFSRRSNLDFFGPAVINRKRPLIRGRRTDWQKNLKRSTTDRPSDAGKEAWSMCTAQNPTQSHSPLRRRHPKFWATSTAHNDEPRPTTLGQRDTFTPPSAHLSSFRNSWAWDSPDEAIIIHHHSSLRHYFSYQLTYFLNPSRTVQHCWHCWTVLTASSHHVQSNSKRPCKLRQP